MERLPRVRRKSAYYRACPIAQAKELNLNSPPASLEAPLRLPDHSAIRAHISRSGISPNALRVLYRLREGGFQAFLVGGCVRDLLLGIEPKDFDVATDALPEEVRNYFVTADSSDGVSTGTCLLRTRHY